MMLALNESGNHMHYFIACSSTGLQNNSQLVWFPILWYVKKAGTPEINNTGTLATIDTLPTTQQQRINPRKQQASQTYGNHPNKTKLRTSAQFAHQQAEKVSLTTNNTSLHSQQHTDFNTLTTANTNKPTVRTHGTGIPLHTHTHSHTTHLSSTRKAQPNHATQLATLSQN